MAFVLLIFPEGDTMLSSWFMHHCHLDQALGRGRRDPTHAAAQEKLNEQRRITDLVDAANEYSN